MYNGIEKYKVYSKELKQDVVPYIKAREFIDSLAKELNQDVDNKLKQAYMEINKAIDSIQNR